MNAAVIVAIVLILLTIAAHIAVIHYSRQAIHYSRQAARDIQRVAELRQEAARRF